MIGIRFLKEFNNLLVIVQIDLQNITFILNLSVMNKNKEKKKSQIKTLSRNKDQIGSRNEQAETSSKLIGAILEKMEDAWKEWNTNFETVLNQESSQIKQTKLNQIKKQQENKPKITKLKVKADISKIKKQQAIQPKVFEQQSANEVKQDVYAKFKKRAKSQNQTQLKSLKKTNELPNIKEEQQKKTLRLKQITKRKIQLMERLKKVDVELTQAKRQASPILDKTGDKSLYQSNLNKSFIANLSNSRLNKIGNQNVVQQHFKAVQMLEKINNEKIRRQQKIAEQFKKKQQAELSKINQLQKKRALQIQQRNRKNELAVSKLLKTRKSKTKINTTRLNQLAQDTQFQQNSVIPMTLVHKNMSKKDGDDLFLDQMPRKSAKNLLTDRDFEQNGDMLAKQFQNAIAEDKKEDKVEDQQLEQPSTQSHQIEQKQLTQIKNNQNKLQNGFQDEQQAELQADQS